MDTLRIYCVTWNVGTGWPDQDLTELLDLESIKKQEKRLPDVFFIALQEVRSQPQNVVLDSLFEEPYTTAIRTLLGPLHYVRTIVERLQGIVLDVFVLRKHLPHLRDIHTTVTRTGFGGFWGNKGAASIRFSLYGCSICVVNSHLSPHDNAFEERCNNYNSIVDHTIFPTEMTSNILYHDYVFWLGDLNFRLNGEMSAEEILKKILSKNCQELISLDQLKDAQKSGKAFAPFVEGDITFEPTYKYQLNSHSYDLSRRPAWTDRILHQVHVDAYENIKLGVKQEFYISHKQYKHSDHKPVSSLYEIKVFAHHHEKGCTFELIKEWEIGSVNVVKYTLDSDVETSSWDYVSIFKDDFTSVHQYVTYTYVPQIPKISVQEVADPLSTRSFQLVFNDELVQVPGSYVLSYYSEKYKCYLALSETFPAIRKP